jgi:hypothetical protein
VVEGGDVDAMTVEVDDVDEDVTDGVVEAEFVDVWVWRFNVIVPGPVIVTVVGLFEPEQASPPEQLQLENV